jgi:hypothetical protein
MKGQISIFDTGKKNRPCEYFFVRYIGQRVRFNKLFEPAGIYNAEEAIITDIFPYYTYCRTKSGKLLVGTPGTIYPAD